MNKLEKYLFRIIPVFIVICLVVTSQVFAFDGLRSWIDPNNNGITKVDDIAGRIWTTIRLVLQIGAFAGIIFAGIRYMFASADNKAEIKKSITTLIIGMVIVFGTTTLVDIVMKIVKDAL